MKQMRRNTSKIGFVLSIVALAVCSVQATTAHAQEWHRDQALMADLSPLNQVPAEFASGRGNFEAELKDDGSLSFSLTYFDMSSSVVQAHIHFGASKTNGGVMVFLCGGPKPACPVSGTVTGTITPSDVSVLPASNPDSVIPQGVAPGNFNAFVTAIRGGNAYVNVHTSDFPNGEIRGQVKVR